VDVLVDGERDGGVGVAEALGDDLDRHTVSEQQGGVGVAEVVQPDRGQLLLPQRLTRLGNVAGDAAGEPFGVPVRAIEVASGTVHDCLSGGRASDELGVSTVAPQGV
jgi:hypothetical protein